MGNYKYLDYGERSFEKENFEFTHKGKVYIRHSESSIKRLVKDLGLSDVYITRDEGWWNVYQHLTQEWMYTPRYY